VKRRRKGRRRRKRRKDKKKKRDKGVEWCTNARQGRGCVHRGVCRWKEGC
jgi:hypothetical protein